MKSQLFVLNCCRIAIRDGVKFDYVLLEILPSFELDRAVAALEVLLVRMYHHMVLELILVPQDFATDL